MTLFMVVQVHAYNHENVNLNDFVNGQFKKKKTQKIIAEKKVNVILF